MMLRNLPTTFIFSNNCVIEDLLKTFYKKEKNFQKMKRSWSWNNWSMDTSIFTNILSFIEILSQQTSLSKIKFIKLQILDSRSSIKKDLSLIKFTNLLLEVQCTCVLKFLMVAVIPQKVMFGQWESSFIKCFMEEHLTKHPVWKNLFLKSIKNKLNSYKNLKMMTFKL